ncbi:PLD nuclease N-terminal domain-containing protein [Ornithinibacillus sp. 4-3]|uniref:PLD nuclease N-terminal domain-containing protein n=1 Tax=Ornithinibacillus sp. 4-3 TaxID=3231488 RepID=A0AB39HMV3_9BACI
MDVFAEINWGLVAPLIIINFIIMIFALVDWIKAEETNGPKLLWLPIILFLSLIGPVLYFVIGRRQY